MIVYTHKNEPLFPFHLTKPVDEAWAPRGPPCHLACRALSTGRPPVFLCLFPKPWRQFSDFLRCPVPQLLRLPGLSDTCLPGRAWPSSPLMAAPLLPGPWGYSSCSPSLCRNWSYFFFFNAFFSPFLHYSSFTVFLHSCLLIAIKIITDHWAPTGYQALIGGPLGKVI